MARSCALLRLAVRPMYLHQKTVANRAVSSLQTEMKVLGIETSADDTCVALLSLKVKPGRGDVGHSIDIRKITYDNKKHKGIHPVEAVQSHTQNLSHMVSDMVGKIKGSKPHLICVTRGPGMGGCLSVGVTTAKALSEAWRVPIIGVHHMQAHALTPVMEKALQLQTRQDYIHYPFLTLLVSGKHTMLVHTKSPVNHRILVQTSSVALGDVLDKVARELVPVSLIDQHPAELPICYPQLLETLVSGYALQDMGAQSREDEIKVYQSAYGWELQPPLRQTVAMKYDFNALCSTTLKIVREKPDMIRRERAVLGLQFMRLAFQHLMSRVILALRTDEELLQNPPKNLILSGGVARNRVLRRVVEDTLQVRGFGDIKLCVPLPSHCVDNAAMIAYAGWKMYTHGWESDKAFCPTPKWSIEEVLTGVDCWTRRSEFPQITPEEAQKAFHGPISATDDTTDPVESLEKPSDETLESAGEELEAAGRRSSPSEEASTSTPSTNTPSTSTPTTTIDQHERDEDEAVEDEHDEDEHDEDEQDQHEHQPPPQLEQLLKRVESILNTWDAGSHVTSTPESLQTAPGAAKDIPPPLAAAQSSTPKQEVAAPPNPPATHSKPASSRESPSPRSEETVVGSKASEKNLTAQEGQNGQKQSGSVKADGAPKGNNNNKASSTSDKLPIKAPSPKAEAKKQNIHPKAVSENDRTAAARQGQPAQEQSAPASQAPDGASSPQGKSSPSTNGHLLAQAPSPKPESQRPYISMRRRTLLQSSSPVVRRRNVRTGKEWPVIPPSEERHELKIHYVGYAEKPEPPPPRTLAGSFMSSIASMFGRGPK